MEERTDRRRIWAENAAIFFLGAFALFLFCVSFFPSLAAARRVQASLEMGRMVERAFSVALFFLATRLYRRLRTAYLAVMGIFVLHLLRGLTARPSPPWTMAVDAVLLALFFLWRRDFRCPSGKATQKKTALFALLAVAAVLANVGLTYHQLRLSAAPGEHIALGDSFALGLVSFVLEILIAIPLGIQAAKKQYSFADYFTTVVSMVCISMPTFFLATLLKYVFSVKLGWFDLSGMWRSISSCRLSR